MDVTPRPTGPSHMVTRNQRSCFTIDTGAWHLELVNTPPIRLPNLGVITHPDAGATGHHISYIIITV
jgi:hypothetical protein